MIDRRKLIEEAQERRLRDVIRKKISLLKEGSQPKSKGFNPHPSTGINVLEDVLKKVVPVIEKQYKSLTSNKSQRRSYRLHILNSIKNLLLPEEVNDKNTVNIQETIGVDLKGINKGKYNDPNKLIKIDDRFDPPKKTKEDEEEEFKTKHTVPGTDETGRNFALVSIRQISQPIEEAYETLSSQEDKDTYFEYLLTNLKLYFDKFEEELGSDPVEPQSPDYTPTEQL